MDEEKKLDVTQSEELQDIIVDEENPLNDMNMKQINAMIKQVGEIVQMMESNWNASKEEFKLTNSHMQMLYKYNEDHRDAMPEGLSEEEKENWDKFNGLNKISEEEALEIFGEGHPIIGITHELTIGRIKDVVGDFFSWLSALREYKQIHEAYIKLVELEEEHRINDLEEMLKKETDPEKISKMQKSLDDYYNLKYLNFMAEKLPEEDVDRICKAFYDEKKIEYWLKRSQDKLKQLKISSKAILEFSQFEKRFLPEKYHKLSNIVLLYFMQTLVYCDTGDKNNYERSKVISMVLGLDSVIRNTSESSIKETIVNNVMKLEDQFIDKIE